MMNRSQQLKQSIEKRKVLFGNPTLGGTYGGHVYTYSDRTKNTAEEISSSHHSGRSSGTCTTRDDENENNVTDNLFRNMVAITDVPPDQIPEGLLNLARRHRSSMEHIRVLISVVDEEDGDEDGKNRKGRTTRSSTGSSSDLEDWKSKSNSLDAFENSNATHTLRHSSNVDFYSGSITTLTNDDSSPRRTSNNTSGKSMLFKNNEEVQPRKKKYLVLITLKSSKAAELFVRNINGQPYNSFESDVIANVHYVDSVILDFDDDDVVVKDDSNQTAATIAAATSPRTSPTNAMKNPKQKPKSPTSSSSSSSTRKKRATSSSSSSNSATKNNISLFYDGTQFVSSSSPSPPPKKNGVSFKRTRSFEKQNCAVCLEQMEFSIHNLMSMTATSRQNNNNLSPNRQNSSTNGTNTSNNNYKSTSIFTTVCNHSFHTECLLQCKDSPCPVCRYDHTGLNESLSKCHICGTNESIHVCLICGVASCWNKNNIQTSTGGTPCAMRGCARQHYDETLHTYALDTSTQHVWDFAGQGYVHRLIQSVDDGKIVEVSDPNSGQMERSIIPQLTDHEENEVVHRKLEGYASQYCSLLKSQLEQQRVYYEGVMDKIRSEYKAKDDDSDCLSELISALKQDKNQLQQRCHVLRKKCDKVAEDVKFLRNMNESLESNKEPLKRQIMNLQRQRTETSKMLDRCLPSLEKKVASLMLELEKDLC